MITLHRMADLAELPAPVQLAMGFFDGVHRGHRQVIAAPAAAGVLRGVLTFEQHPLSLVAPQRAPRLLTPCAAQKAALLAAAGAEVLLCLPFDAALAQMSPQAFLESLLNTGKVAGFSVGSNWHFGKGGAGDARFLADFAAAHGIPAVVNELVACEDGGYVCSSRIRAVVGAGEMALAAELLGHPYTLFGTVEHGQHLARTLGFPTANITVAENAALPPFGVYEVLADIDGRTVRGIANLGIRPTIEETRKVVRLETHFIDFSGDLYSRPLTVALQRFIRPERKFDSVTALKAQIAEDLFALTGERKFEV